MGGAGEAVVVEVVVADPGLEGVLARQVEVIGRVQVVADLAPLEIQGRLVDRAAGPAGVVEQAGIGHEEGIAGEARIGGPEVVVGGVGRGDLLVGRVSLVPAAAVAQQQVVADGIVGGQRGALVGVIVAFQAPRVGRGAVAEDAGNGPPVLREAVDVARGQPQAAEGSGRDANGPAPAVGLGRERVEGTDPPVEVPQGRGLVVAGVERPEEPQLVLDDVAAEADDPFVPAVAVAVLAAVEIEVVVVDVLVPVAGTVGVAPQEGPGVALHVRPVVLVEAHDVAVELVAARPRDDVDDAAHRAAVFGVVAGGRDLDLLEQLEDDVLRLAAVVEVRDVRAVDVEHVLRPGRAVHGQAGRVGLLLDAGDGADERIERPAPGQGQEDLLGHDLALDRALDVDQGGHADDRDLFLDGRLLEGHVQAQGLRQLELDALADQGLEALEREGDVVGAGRQGHQAVDAVDVRDRGGLADQLGTDGFDAHAGQGASLRIGDPAVDPPGRRELRQGGPGESEKERQDERERSFCHALLLL